MNQLNKGQKPQNIFLIADHLQKTYKNFVKTFQTFQNPVIQKWVNQQMEKEELLYKDPLIELNFQFEKGKPLQKFVQEGSLNPKILEIFNIEPYKHQSEAIEKVCKENRNIIVSTGTGSGKSICFWVPIVNTCLEMKHQGLDGIKAIVIFPMNALANSQYNIIAKELHGTGLKVGRYTGDTAYSEEEAIRLLEKNQGRAPYDSEVLSRDKIRESPPDILITNYVMLDLILTRFEDKVLFPDRHRGHLKYLVLDEIHTYSGNSGADVAGLIRRLKERTKVHKKIRCIGTSATIQDNKKTGGTASIIEFAEKIFGEDFDSNSLIEASYVDLEVPKEEILDLPSTITILESDLKQFDGTFGSIITIAEKLLGRSLEQNERTPESLGKLFNFHPLIIFLRNKLKDQAKALRTLAKEYRIELRNGETIEKCLLELKAAFLLGTIAKITIQNIQRPLLVPKLHTFFTQGQEIYSCLSKDNPHLSVEGDITCKVCETPSFPLYFCRNCGHEFYSVFIVDNQVFPRTYEMEEVGELAYLTPINERNSSFYTPDNWLDSRGNIRSTYKDASPERAEYCPKCNNVNAECSCSEKFSLWKIPYPFQICPSCNIFYTKKKGEFGKLASFNSTGRSSSTDILTMKAIKHLSKEQKKQIIFTDNRQDTALQAEHLNEFQRRTNFRQIYFHTLKNIHSKGERVSDIEIGRKIFQFLQASNLVPEYQKEEEDEFSTAPPPEREFVEFLTFLALSDIMQSQYFLDLNLDKLGLLKLEYDGLEKLIKHNYVTESSEFKMLSEEERYDYFRGLLDIFRWNGAIANNALMDTVNKYDDWQSKFNEEILFDINKSHFNRVGFAFERPEKGKKVHMSRQRIIFKSISWHNTVLINWTKKLFDEDEFERANNILIKAIDILERASFIEPFWTNRPSFKLYQIKAGKIIFNLNSNSEYLTCPKCQRVYHFKKFKKCAWRNCPDLEFKPLNEDHYYLKLYRKVPDKESEIHAKEHSAQVGGNIREKFENAFQDNSLGTTNVLVCTPTMELGIDIGELSAILMRNVPPDPSRYAQRAGRAGRSNQPSVISVFCGRGIVKGPHDQYFYNEPEKIVSGKINPPNFLLDNRKLIEKHIHSAIIETLSLKIPQKMGEILNLDNRNENFPVHDHFENSLKSQINNNKVILRNTINSIFKNEIGKYVWFNEDFINASIANFYSDLNKILDNFRDSFGEILDELNFLHQKSISGGSNITDRRAYEALQRKLNDMRNGNQPYDTFGFLRNYGFLPNYAFPSDTTLLTMYNQNEPNYHENWRSSVIAIREFAPHNQVYFLGSKYNINKAMVKSDRGEIKVDKIYICENCNEILVDGKNFTSSSLVKCPNCGETIDLGNFKSCIRFPHMYSISGPRITCDEENRQIRGYEITMNYRHDSSKLEHFEIHSGDNVLASITYEHNGKIYLVNKGSRVKSISSNEVRLQPFNFCSACGQWLYEQEALKHVDNCPKNGKSRNQYDKLWLFIKGTHDVIVFNLPIIGDLGEPDINSYYITLKEVILQSIMLSFNLDESELNSFTNPIPGKVEQSIVIFETEEGGSGVLKSLLDTTTTQFDKFIENMIRILHIRTLEPYEETMDACVKACYNCLLRFRNQFEHKFINRKVLIPLMKLLKNYSLDKKESDLNGDINERLNILKENCDSELEKEVLDEIVKQKMPLPHGKKTYYDEDIPVTKVDFYYSFPNREICIFVDGPPHAPEVMQRVDREKRNILEYKLGHTVIELDFRNGRYIDDHSLIEKEVSKLRDYLIL